MGGAKPSVKIASYTSPQDPKAALFCACLRFLHFVVRSGGVPLRVAASFHGFRRLFKSIHEAGVS